MRLIPLTLEPEGEYIELVTTSDLHLGSREHDAIRADKHRQYILGHPDRFTLSLGDDLENATRASIGAGVYEQVLRPREQREYAKAFYEPLADGKRVLGFIAGNHGQRTIDMADFSPEEWLADALNVRYFGYHAHIKLRVGKQVYTIFATHGSTGAQTDGGLLNALMKLREVCDADTYLQGHAHRQLVHEVPVWRPDLSHCCYREYRQVFAVSGAFLHYGGYAAQKNYARRDQGMVAIRFYANERKIEPERLRY